MKTVVMEIRFRVCTTPRGAQRFFDHAARIVAATVPSHVERAHILEQSNSTLLRRQWERSNGALPPGGLQTLDVGFGFYDPTGRLTIQEVESIANTALAALPPASDTATREHVPWILTLNAGMDPASRAAITDQYRSLNAGRLQSRRLAAAISGRDHTHE